MTSAGCASGYQEWRRVPLAVPPQATPTKGVAYDFFPRGEVSAAWRRHALRL